MESRVILIDTSILIDLFRKTDKANSALIALVKQGYVYSISAITEYEIYTGAKLEQSDFWDTFLKMVQVLPFDKKTARIAVQINSELKKKRKQIDIADLFIAATAVSHNLPLATLNLKHFNRISNLVVL